MMCAAFGITALVFAVPYAYDASVFSGRAVRRFASRACLPTAL